MFQFDENGHLTPFEPIEITLDEFQATFVDAFPESKTRRWLFENYLDWVFDFQRDVYPYFVQWINGSFVTKKENPNDLDFVTFLEGSVFEKRKKAIEPFWSFSNEGKGLDAYILPMPPENDSDFQTFIDFRNTWHKRFTAVRRGQTFETNRRGFIQIQFSK